MDSKLFRLSFQNLVNGLIVAVGSAVIVTLEAWLQNPDFSVFALSFSDVRVLGNIGLAAGLAYLAKKFFSTENGKLLGKI